MENSNNDKRVAEYLVIDSGGFIKNAPLHEYGQELITLHGVIDEIRDKATKQRLQALPFELVYKEPDSESVKKVIEFSRKTGDYGSLSATDLKVLALTYMLEVQHVGVSHLSTEPTIRPTVEITKPQKLSQEVNADGSKAEVPGHQRIVGFVHPKHDDDEDDEEDDDGEASDAREQEHGGDKADPETALEAQNDVNEAEKDEWADVEDDDDVEDGEEDPADDDDDEGWITPSNFVQKRLEMFGVEASKKPEVVKVACMTTDFAMQNVLRQMGLNVVSVDGVVIHETKTWIKRCYACFKTVPDVSKEFCPKCGNQTLKRVSVSLNADGTMKIHISGRRPLTARGKKYSLPTPQGGKHAMNPILTADQPLPQQRLAKAARARTNALDPDYIAGSSPFSTRDVTSRSAMLTAGGQHKYWMKRNPNEVGRKTGNRKKRTC